LFIRIPAARNWEMEPAAAMILPLVLALCTAMASAAVVEHTFNVNFSYAIFAFA
jgi:hypothetical protein